MGGLTNQNRYAAATPAENHQDNYAKAAEDVAATRTVTTLKVDENGGAAFPNPTRHFPPHQPMLHQHLLDQPVLPRSPVMVSPTHSASSGTTSSNNSCFHYNPYDTACSRVVHQQQSSLNASSVNSAYHHRQQEPDFQNQNQYNGNITDATMDNHNSYYNTNNNAVEENYPQYENVAPAKSKLPFGTLHGSLEGLVTFVPYPTEEFQNPNHQENSAPLKEANLSRVFLGQLPYQVTDMQLDWLCFTFGAGGAVHFPERITKHDPMRGCKVPTGCIHAYADNAVAGPMLSSLHKRILVDDSGVWFADGEEEQRYLNDYCLMMKTDRTKRYQNRPYDTVVAQFATSNFVRRR